LEKDREKKEKSGRETGTQETETQERKETEIGKEKEEGKEKETEKVTPAPASKRKPYIYQHRHCVYCGRMIEVKGRDYCLRCKPEYQKEVSKRSRAQKFQKFLKFYIIGIIILLVGIVLYSLR